MFEGIPVVDVHIHAARRTTLKVDRPLWALGLIKKAIFGTDRPGAPGFRHDIEGIVGVGLSDETLERVLWRNANDVYRLGL